ncbi:MAG: sigma 54-interacting transcriptional regulator [Anaerolineae bacterium]
MAATILIIEDRTSQSYFLKQQFEDLGYEVLTAETGKEGLGLFWTHEVDVVLLDWLLPDTKGLAVLQEIRKDDDQVPVIMMTAYPEVEIAVDAMRLGAFDYIRKPFNLADLQRTVEKALESLAMKRQLQILQGGERAPTGDWIVGNNPEMRKVARIIERISTSNANVLIEGESGTGKEVVAREIHRRSHRSHKPFLPINCAAIPDQLLESELFGFEAGAFTGARRQRKGLLEAADGGTVFLDEIASMPLEMQAKILRVLEDKLLRRVGGNNDIRVDVRFISATNRNLIEAIEQEAFREDLYWRLGVITIKLVPLRERRSDIGLFVAAFIEQFNQETGKNVRGITGEALELMRAYHWPGNIRELRNVIERAVILCDGDEISVNHLPTEIAAQRPHPAAVTTAPEPKSTPPRPPSVLGPAAMRQTPSFDEETRRTLHQFFQTLPLRRPAGVQQTEEPEGQEEVARSDASAFAEIAPEEQATLLENLMQRGEDYHRLWLAAELLATIVSDARRLERLKAVFQAREETFPRFLLALGLAYEGKGDFESALDYLLQTLALDPTSCFAHYDLGWVQRQLGRHGDAVSSFGRAIALQPRYVDAFNQLGITHFEQRDYSRALTAFESAVALEPENPYHYFNVGYVQKMLGNYDAALAAFSRALQLAPSYREAAAQLESVEKAQSTPALEAINRVPFFEELPLEHRLLICEHLRSVSYLAGRVVIQQGDPGDAFYIVEEGRLQVSITGHHDEEIIMGELERGAYFGEIALLEGGARRTATVKALTPVRLLVLSREQFEKVNAEFPSVAQNLVQTRNERLRQDVLRTLEEGGRRWEGTGTSPAEPPAQEMDRTAEDQEFSVLTAMVLPSAPFTQTLGSRAMLTFLKEFYFEMVQVIGDRGVIRQYTGDRIVALFEEPQSAVEVAIAMWGVFTALAERWKQGSPVVLHLGLGIATGPLSLDATSVSGSAMHVSHGLSRLDREDGRILTDEATAHALQGTPLEPLLTELPQPIHLPGLGDPLNAYRVSPGEAPA